MSVYVLSFVVSVWFCRIDARVEARGREVPMTKAEFETWFTETCPEYLSNSYADVVTCQLATQQL